MTLVEEYIELHALWYDPLFEDFVTDEIESRLLDELDGLWDRMSPEERAEAAARAERLGKKSPRPPR